MNKYENLGVVGEGSYGIVMKCRHINSGEIVAVKKFLESDDDQLIKKIAMREINMLKKLRHENLVNLIEVFRRKRHLYLVLEYVNHTILDELENHLGGLGEETSREYVWQILRGLNCCHLNNIVHRDIKPENVLVSNMGVIKLCDFGFARMLSTTDESCTDYVATRWYRAPELLVGDTRYGREVDVWAVGCLLAEMISGDPVFPGESDIDQLFCIMRHMGNLSDKHQAVMSSNPMFNGITYQPQKTTSLKEKFSMWPKLALAFLQECLQMDPENRGTTSQLLEHKYFTWDGFPSRFLPELQKKLQHEFSSNLEFSKPASKTKNDTPQHKPSAKFDEMSEEMQKENDMLLNKALPAGDFLPPCTIPLSRLTQPLRPPVKIAPLTPSKSKKNFQHVVQEEESNSKDHHLATLSMPPISVHLSDNRSAMESKRHLSPNLKNKEADSILNQPATWLTTDRSRKPTPVYLRKNVDLFSVCGSSNSLSGDLGAIHGERSLLHNRAFVSSQKKKSKADASSLYAIGESDNDKVLPNIVTSPGLLSPMKNKTPVGQRRLSCKGLIPNISTSDCLYDKFSDFSSP